jgi:CheY-like chemotaxis protein
MKAASILAGAAMTLREPGRMLLVESNDRRRAELSTVLEAAGFAVVAVGRVAEVERWPADQVVITEADRFTPWWRQVGATHVIVLANDAAQGEEACSRGAAAWLDRQCDPQRLMEALSRLGVQEGNGAGRRGAY